MKKLLTLIILAAGIGHAQTYNVAITNSLLGPVDLAFTGTQVNVDQAIITGAVVNASISNSFSPTTVISNDFTFGAVSVTNILENINITNIIENVALEIGATTITNIFEAGAFSNYFVNNFNGDFTQTTFSNFYNSFSGVNVFTPAIGSTNVSGTWTITIDTNSAALRYIQTGNITSVVFSVDSTNDVGIANVLFTPSGGSITWPTNTLSWAAGSAPTMATGLIHSLYFEAYRGYTFGVYIGGRP